MKKIIMIVVITLLAVGLSAQETMRYVSVSASYWRTGGINWVTPYEVFRLAAQWDGHPRQVQEDHFANDDSNLPTNDPRVLTNRTRMISEIRANLPEGEELDFLMFQDQSEQTAVSWVGTNGVQVHVDKAVGWGKVAQGVSTGAVVVMCPTWARPRPSDKYAPGGSFEGRGPAEFQAEVNDAYGQSVQAINDDPDAGTAIQTHLGDAWEQKDWTNGLYQYDGDDHHSNVRGDLLAGLVTYATFFQDDTSDIYSKNSDLSHPDFTDPTQPTMKSGSNGTNDVIDLLVMVNADLEQAPLSTEYLHPLTLDDWHELAHIADRVTFTGGDANTDGEVDTTDLALINANLGASNDVYWGEGDFNGDGSVNQADLDIYYVNSGILQISVSSVDIPEGTTRVFQVRLTAEPAETSTVTVTRLSGDTDISVQSGSNLVFTTSNWGIWQPVTLSAAEDADFSNGAAVIRCLLEGQNAEYLDVTEADDETDPDYALPWSEPFDALTQGTLDGQHGWVAEAGAIVTNSDAQSGSQSLSISEATASHTFDGNSSNVWVEFWAQPVSGAEPESIPAGASAVFYVSTNDQRLVAYDFTNATELAGATVSNGWNKFAVACDYSSKVWNLELNDELVVSNFAFYGSPASFNAIEITEASTNAFFVDSIEITASLDDSDGDGLPDEWEEFYFSGDVDPLALSSNGVNTVIEAYIAGLDPTNPTAQFTLDSLGPLQWTAVSGRVYSIYWTSNLLNGFGLPWQTNITGGAYTDTTHSAEEEGFYKIDVELE